MHDIGKLSIPDALFVEARTVDADERRIMQTHAKIGFPYPWKHVHSLLQLAAEIALSHHERFDGKGYPKWPRRRADPAGGPHRQCRRCLWTP